MNRTALCPQTKQYRGRDNSGTMREMLLCKQGHFVDARVDHVVRLKRGRHECALCLYRIEREAGKNRRATVLETAIELRQALQALLTAAGPLEGALAVTRCHNILDSTAWLEDGE